jgi:hypothetical protein
MSEIQDIELHVNDYFVVRTYNETHIARLRTFSKDSPSHILARRMSYDDIRESPEMAHKTMLLIIHENTYDDGTDKGIEITYFIVGPSDLLQEFIKKYPVETMAEYELRLDSYDALNKRIKTIRHAVDCPDCEYCCSTNDQLEELQSRIDDMQSFAHRNKEVVKQLDALQKLHDAYKRTEYFCDQPISIIIANLDELEKKVAEMELSLSQ